MRIGGAQWALREENARILGGVRSALGGRTRRNAWLRTHERRALNELRLTSYPRIEPIRIPRNRFGCPSDEIFWRLGVIESL